MTNITIDGNYEEIVENDHDTGTSQIIVATYSTLEPVVEEYRSHIHNDTTLADISTMAARVSITEALINTNAALISTKSALISTNAALIDHFDTLNDNQAAVIEAYNSVIISMHREIPIVDGSESAIEKPKDLSDDLDALLSTMIAIRAKISAIDSEIETNFEAIHTIEHSQIRKS